MSIASRRHREKMDDRKAAQRHNERMAEAGRYRWLERKGGEVLLGQCLSGLPLPHLVAGQLIRRDHLDKAIARVVRTEPKNEYRRFVIRALVGHELLKDHGGKSFTILAKGADLGLHWAQRKVIAEAAKANAPAQRIEWLKERMLAKPEKIVANRSAEGAPA